MSLVTIVGTALKENLVTTTELKMRKYDYAEMDFQCAHTVYFEENIRLNSVSFGLINYLH